MDYSDFIIVRVGMGAAKKTDLSALVGLTEKEACENLILNYRTPLVVSRDGVVVAKPKNYIEGYVATRINLTIKNGLVESFTKG